MCVEQEYFGTLLWQNNLNTFHNFQKHNTMSWKTEINLNIIQYIVLAIVGPEDMCKDFKISQNVKLF